MPRIQTPRPMGAAAEGGKWVRTVPSRGGRFHELRYGKAGAISPPRHVVLVAESLRASVRGALAGWAALGTLTSGAPPPYLPGYSPSPRSLIRSGVRKGSHQDQVYSKSHLISIRPPGGQPGMLVRIASLRWEQPGMLVRNCLARASAACKCLRGKGA